MKTQVPLSSFFLDFDFQTDYTGSYSILCNIVDNGQLLNIATYNGTDYTIEYGIILSFGLTELTAQYIWKENVGCDYVSVEIGSDKCFPPTRVSRDGLTFLLDCLHVSSSSCLLGPLLTLLMTSNDSTERWVTIHVVSHGI